MARGAARQLGTGQRPSTSCNDELAVPLHIKSRSQVWVRVGDVSIQRQGMPRSVCKSVSTKIHLCGLVRPTKRERDERQGRSPGAGRGMEARRLEVGSPSPRRLPSHGVAEAPANRGPWYSPSTSRSSTPPQRSLRPQVEVPTLYRTVRDRRAFERRTDKTRACGTGPVPIGPRTRGYLV